MVWLRRASFAITGIYTLSFFQNITKKYIDTSTRALNWTNTKRHWRTLRSTAAEIQIQRLGGQDRQTLQKEPQHQPHQQKYNVKIKSEDFKCLFLREWHWKCWCDNDNKMHLYIDCAYLEHSYSLKQILDSKDWLTDDHNFQLVLLNYLLHILIDQW